MRYATKDQFLWVHGYCTWCWNEVEPPKQNWCGRECVDEYLIRRSSTDARRITFARDQGVCSECDLDTVELHQHFVRYVGKMRMQAIRMECVRRGPHPTPEAVSGRVSGGSLWDMDHVLPVKDGGGGCGLDNLQTLCVWCHDDKTHRREATGSQVEMSL